MKFILATRKSPLALTQTEMVAARIKAAIPGAECELLKIVTTGDQRLEWSLAKQGGKGLFTAELEQALLRGEAHDEAGIAVDVDELDRVHLDGDEKRHDLRLS